MKQIQIQKKTQNKSFPIKLQSNISTFQPSLKKIDSSIQMKTKFSSNSVNTVPIVSSNKIETKTDINNRDSDIYYNEFGTKLIV